MQSLKAWKKIAIIAAIASLNACSFVHHKPAIESPRASLQNDLSDGDYRRAITALKAGKDEEALNLFNAAAKAHPDFAAPYINVGLIEIKKDHLPAAETALLHAAKLAPRQPEIYNGLGIVYRRMGRFHDAETAYLTALQFAPDYADAQLNIGILYDIYLNNLNAALDHYERYEAISGGDNKLVAKWVIDVKQRMTRNIGSLK
jgi:tetratricopeptide (TPR) repeat protein